MSDTYEVKAAVLAAKENTSLPVMVTLIFDERAGCLPAEPSRRPRRCWRDWESTL